MSNLTVKPKHSLHSYVASAPGLRQSRRNDIAVQEAATVLVSEERLVIRTEEA